MYNSSLLLRNPFKVSGKSVVAADQSLLRIVAEIISLAYRVISGCSLLQIIFARQT
jgi:hypothetical protein